MAFRRLAILLLVAALLVYTGGLAEVVHLRLAHAEGAASPDRATPHDHPQSPGGSGSHDDCPVCQSFVGLGATFDWPPPCPLPADLLPVRPAVGTERPAAQLHSSFPIAARAPPWACA